VCFFSVRFCLWLQGFLFHFGGFLLPLHLAFFRAASFALFALALSLLPLSLFGRLVFLLLLFQRALEAKLLPELCRAHRYSGAQVYAGARRGAGVAPQRPVAPREDGAVVHVLQRDPVEHADFIQLGPERRAQAAFVLLGARRGVAREQVAGYRA